MKFPFLAGVLALATSLSGCTETVSTTGETPLFAQAKDTGSIDRNPLAQRQAAIAYDPDGCQNWIIDDGAEGYASRRRDPVSGLPVCNKQFPPGTVVKDPRFTGFPDILPN